MKVTVNIARVIVGVLFIFSGLVKANDPLGLSYKMQEFFEIWDMMKFSSWTLPMSILMNAFEIIAGFALLLGWRIKLFSWLLLLLIVFFTFLTGYTYITGKPTNCGCFGDCLPISSKTSFLKDLLLLILIGFLFFYRKNIKPLFNEKGVMASMLFITVISFGFQWYTLTYLPVVDCLPFKKGNNIAEKMKIPAGARPDSFAIRFVYEKGGRSFEFSPAELPADLGTYKFVSRVDKLIRKGNAEPAIKGFALTGESNIDSTMIVLGQLYAVMLVSENFSVPASAWQKDFEKLYVSLKAKNVPAYFVTARMEEAAKTFSNTPLADMPVFKCDVTAIRTAARTSPCIYLLKEGTIVDKWSYKNINAIEKNISAIPVQPLPAAAEPAINH